MQIENKGCAACSRAKKPIKKKPLVGKTITGQQHTNGGK